MPQVDHDTVTHSYFRCICSDNFLDTFYSNFLAKSEEIARKFRTTEFDRQKRLLRESLLMMVTFDRNPDRVQEAMDLLAERHSRRGVDIPPHLYAMWLDSLCEAIESHDPQFTPETASKWRSAMQPGIAYLTSKY